MFELAFNSFHETSVSQPKLQPKLKDKFSNRGVLFEKWSFENKMVRKIICSKISAITVYRVVLGNVGHWVIWASKSYNVGQGNVGNVGHLEKEIWNRFSAENSIVPESMGIFLMPLIIFSPFVTCVTHNTHCDCSSQIFVYH